MSVTTAIALDKRYARKSNNKNAEETKNYQACIRVTFNRQPRYFPTGVELTLEQFEKLPSPRLGEKLRETKENLEKHHERAKTIIKNLNKFSFEAFSVQFGAFVPGERRKKRKRPVEPTENQLVAAKPASLDGSAVPRVNFANQFGGRKYPRNKSEIDFKALGEVAVYYGQYIQKLEAKDQAGTISNYVSSLMSLLNFKPQLRFADITDVWLLQYEKHMKNAGRSTTTISMYTRCLRRIFNIVIAKRIIDGDLYPFGRDLYVVPGGRKRKKTLKMPDIQALFEERCESEAEQMCKELWFFMYVGNGMNVKDMCLLKFGQLSEQFCRFIRAKTINTTKEDPQEITFFCDEFMLAVIARWGNQDQAPDNYIFPFLEHGLDGYGVRDKVQLVTKLINKHVKAVAARAGVTKLPTTNDARHAFATMLKKAGKSTEFIRELIGHENEGTTRNYLDDFDDDVKTDVPQTLLPFRVTNNTPEEEGSRSEVLKMVEPGMARMIVSHELDMIEAFASSNHLPAHPELYPSFQAMGFILFPGNIAGDLKVTFIEATMPEGWTRRINKKKGWNVEVADELGRTRVSFHYKPDDHLYTTFRPRYTIEYCRDNMPTPEAVQLCIWDNQAGKAMLFSQVVDAGKFRDNRKTAESQLAGYLAVHFPSWNDPAQYWSGGGEQCGHREVS